MLRKVCSLRVFALSLFLIVAVYVLTSILKQYAEKNNSFSRTYWSKPEELYQRKDLANSNLIIVPGTFSSTGDAGRISTENERKHYLEGLKLHSFNEYLSNRLSLNRGLPDFRSDRCLMTEYDMSSLPQVAVVVTFYNEATSTLLRAIHSVINRSPPELIARIVLVDDSSSDPMLEKPLDDYVSQTFNGLVTVIRNRKREGLIRSRMIGANVALAQVLIFLDSHVEVTVGWLEPLLARLLLYPHSVVVPFTDIIDADSFEYRASPSVRGGFNWGLRFSWEPIPSQVLKIHDDYIPTPTMAGGLLAVDRNYFFKLGGYDEEMRIWGGENIEMSFRTWMCGGSIVIAMCSRVGHVFRDKRPYTSPDGENTFLLNSVRLAKVWMDQHAVRFLTTAGLSEDSLNTVDVDARRQLRTKLSCNDFSWYLDNIYNPDTRVRGQTKRSQGENEIEAVISTKLQDTTSGLCVSTLHINVMHAIPGDSVAVQKCSLAHTWLAAPTSYGSLQLFLTELCLDVVRERPLILKCNPTTSSQSWGLKALNGRNVLYHRGSGLCLSLGDTSNPGDRIKMAVCDKSMTISRNQS